MMFGNRKVKEAKHVLSGSAKLLASRRDLLSEERIRMIEEKRKVLRDALQSPGREGMEAAQKDLEAACEKVLPKYRHPLVREYCEVILVAIVLAAGIRAYFLQPFKIPTGSMQPTLNGIIGHVSDAPPPVWPVRMFEKLAMGRTYVNVVAQRDEQIVDIRLVAQNFFMTRSVIETTAGRYDVPMPVEHLQSFFGVQRGRTYRAGEPIVQGYVDTGDQVFVDKMSYHFVRPKLGEVFVFRTTGIPGMQGSQFYIKRIAGLGGQTLRIDPPDLFVDGEVPQVFGLLRVMSEADGYRGYANASWSGNRFQFLGNPQVTYRVGEDAFFALGDNSYNSLDSRSWGGVPERNVVGRGFLVYWPFTKHWGVIR